MSNVFATAISGMNAAIARLSNAATNIVNVSSTGKLPSAENEKATSFAPMDVVSLSNSSGDNNLGVRTTLVPRDPSYVVVRDEKSPDANEDGLIAAPNIDLTSEIVTTMMAEIAYKASAKLIAVEKQNQETLINTLS